MATLNALGEEQVAAWKDRVAIVPVSIDSQQARVKSHLRQRGWTGDGGRRKFPRYSSSNCFSNSAISRWAVCDWVMISLVPRI